MVKIASIIFSERSFNFEKREWFDDYHIDVCVEGKSKGANQWQHIDLYLKDNNLRLIQIIQPDPVRDHESFIGVFATNEAQS